MNENEHNYVARNGYHYRMYDKRHIRWMEKVCDNPFETMKNIKFEIIHTLKGSLR